MIFIKKIIKKTVKFFLYRLIDFVERHHRLRSCMVAFVRKVGLDTAVSSVYRRLSGRGRRRKKISKITHLKCLSPYSSQIYLNMRNAIARQQQETR